MQHQRVCHDTRPWLIPFSLDVMSPFQYICYKILAGVAGASVLAPLSLIICSPYLFLASTADKRRVLVIVLVAR